MRRGKKSSHPDPGVLYTVVGWSVGVCEEVCWRMVEPIVKSQTFNMVLRKQSSHPDPGVLYEEG